MTINGFLSGVIFALSWVIALIFLKFWKRSADRLFAIFAVSFFLLGIERVILVLCASDAEAHGYVYGIRLVAFALIVIGIVQKNLQARR